MKTRITWHIDGIVDSNKNASLVTTSDEPHIVQKALKSFAPTSTHPHTWPVNLPSRVFNDPVTGQLVPMGLSWGEDMARMTDAYRGESFKIN